MRQQRRALIIVVSAAALFLGAVLISVQHRSFYCVDANHCVTVWKRSGGVTYVVPGKYYGLTSPRSTRIETTPHQYFVFYFSHPDDSTIIVRDDGSSRGYSDFTIVDESQSKWTLIEYTEDMRQDIFIEGPARRRDVLPHINYIELNIRENYARDKFGNKL